MEITKIEKEIAATEERLRDLKNLKTGYLKVFGEEVNHRVGKRGPQKHFTTGLFAGSSIKDSIDVALSDGSSRTAKEIAKIIFGRATDEKRLVVSRALTRDRSKYLKEGKVWTKI